MAQPFRWTRERYRRAHHLNRLLPSLAFNVEAPFLVRQLWKLTEHQRPDPLETPLRVRLRARRDPDDDIPF